jgi:NAD(P)-dependent dehydrogenase (short-subunit alcohol dehydrogenase family)
MAVVLITGCSTGIGLHTAIAFAEHGDTVVASMRNTGKADGVRKLAADAGVEVDVVELDVTDAASAGAAVADIAARHGRIDVLVNNAGVALSGAIEDFPEDQARAGFETNVWGPVRMARLVLPGMRAQGSGVIVNVSSFLGRIPSFPTYGFYVAGKHALGALSESLAGEVAPFGIRVVCLEPGYYATALADTVDQLAAQLDPSSPYADLTRFMLDFTKGLLDNGGHPREVGDAIVAAVADPDSPVHVPVGGDADAFVDLWRQTGTFEAFMTAANAVLFGDGASPPA